MWFQGKNKREENSVFRERFRYDKQRRGIGMSNTHTRYPRVCTHSTQNFPSLIALPKTLSFPHQKLAINLKWSPVTPLKNLRRGWGFSGEAGFCAFVIAKAPTSRKLFSVLQTSPRTPPHPAANFYFFLLHF